MRQTPGGLGGRALQGLGGAGGKPKSGYSAHVMSEKNIANSLIVTHLTLFVISLNSTVSTL